MSTNPSEHKWHVLDFICDDNGNSAITILYQATRFQIIADVTNLNTETDAGGEYHSFVHDYRKSISSELPEKIEDSQTDSGVDVASSKAEEKEEEDQTDDSPDAESALQAWMVAPLEDSLEDLAPKSNTNGNLTLHEWYHRPTRFCGLFVSDDGSEIEARELEQTSKMKQSVQSLIPELALPKNLAKKLDVPFYLASEFEVIGSSDQPPGTPYHPCRLLHRKTKKTYFVKVVDNNQHIATKRELKILQQMRDLHLGDQIRTPMLEGIIAFGGKRTGAGKRKIMGVLQTPILDPTPLTLMFDSSISQKKRDGWAKTSKEFVNVLHDNGIIWGDSKADNFVVDKDDNLWIIDFGGSRTEGWVDLELNETEEGDKMGIRKTVNGLKDPAKNCVSSDTEVRGSNEAARKGCKRKRENNQAEPETQQSKKRSRR